MAHAASFLAASHARVTSFAPATATKSAQRFNTLEGIRGLAAIVVVILHAGPQFLPRQVANGYLAVDLFFLLSGFIISYSYEPKLAAGLGVGEFMRARVIRLYPLYAVGTFGMALLLVAELLLAKHPIWSWSDVGRATAAAAFFLPSTPPEGMASVFPLNPPAWSLFYEMLANLAYVVFFPMLSLRRLAAIVTVAALALAFSAAMFGHLDGGSLVGLADVCTGLARVSFSFFLGVIMCRLYRKGRLPVPARLSAFWIVCLTLLVLSFDPGPMRAISDFAMIAVVIPALAACAINVEPSKRYVGGFALLGTLSYPLYAIHMPVFQVIERALYRFGYDSQPPYWAIAIGLAALLATSWILDLYFDRPVRRMLLKLTAPRVRAVVTTETAPPQGSARTKLDLRRGVQPFVKPYLGATVPAAVDG